MLMVKGSQVTHHKAVTLYKIALMDSFVQKGFALDWLSYSSKTIGQRQHCITWSDKFSMVVMLCLYLVKVRFVLRNDLEDPNLILRTVEPQLEGTRGFHRPPGKSWGRGTGWISHPGSEIHFALGLNKLVKLSLSIQTRPINEKYLTALPLSVQSTLASL